MPPMTTTNIKTTIKDTFQLDTLVVDGKNATFITSKIEIKPGTEEAIFNQVVLNKTGDTLELDSRASDGGAYAAFDKTILPGRASRISYFLITKGRSGVRQTFIDLMYKQKDSKRNFMHIGVTIISHKES